MNFSLTSEQQLLQDSARRFIDKTCGFEARTAQVKAGAAGSASNWSAFADKGWLMAAIPEAFGGLGGTLTDTALIAHELGRGLVLDPYLGCAVLAAQTLVAGGSTAQKEALLPSFCDGTLRIALAYSEAESRGMALPVQTVAMRSANGYLLTGRKTLVLGACGADKFIVSAQLAGAANIILLLVDGDALGLQRQAMPLHDGSWVEELRFDGVEVATANLLGGGADGLTALRAGLEHGIVALCAELVGGMEKVIELTAEYLKTRQQFGIAIGNFQALQHRIADMAAEMELARSMLHAALAAMHSDDAATRRKTLSAAKSLVARAARQVCSQGIQLHGGIGMTEEYQVGHYYKRAIVADFLLGSSDRHDAARAGLAQF